ncbi:N-acetylgalactosamine kinase-like isoform X1 [Acipenser oxyrinchus oxyrinchus]|nr:N-acetylgalactosamine kinase-like isoform X1 [Acipenser oxyrinchus oxyrinchus]
MATNPPPKLQVQSSENDRLKRLKETFISKFGLAPVFYARALGQVNLIGEHIDYCGYAVLPMAIEQDILTAVSLNKTQVIQLANTNPLYPDFTSRISDIHIDKTKPLWHYYFLCGLKGIQEHFSLACPPGLTVLWMEPSRLALALQLECHGVLCRARHLWKLIIRPFQR